MGSTSVNERSVLWLGCLYNVVELYLHRAQIITFMRVSHSQCLCRSTIQQANLSLAVCSRSRLTCFSLTLFMARSDSSSDAASEISSLAGSSTVPPPSEPPSFFSSSLDGEDGEVNGVGVVDEVPLLQAFLVFHLPSTWRPASHLSPIALDHRGNPWQSGSRRSSGITCLLC